MLGVMKIQTSTSTPGVPDAFLTKFGQHVTGILCGFDRLLFQGSLRVLFQPKSMEAYLSVCHVLIKDFKVFAQKWTDRIKAEAYAAAGRAGRPVAVARHCDARCRADWRKLAKRFRHDVGDQHRQRD